MQQWMVLAADDEDDKKGPGCYLVSAFFGLITILVIKGVWPSLIPFDMFQFWTFQGTIKEVFAKSWPLLVWGIALNTPFLLLRDSDSDAQDNAELYYFYGSLLSVWAGVVEEICFRWILFYSEIVGFKCIGALFLGLPYLLYGYVIGPVANFFTLGYLGPYLFGSWGWAVGAAIIGSNGKFRDGHTYQGPLGVINSWFCGMYFFYLMFTHGLLAAMLIHFLFDFFVFTLEYITNVIRRNS